MGNQNELDDPNEEIATDYTEQREIYNRNTTTIDINFISKIAIVIGEDSEPKSMAECRKCSGQMETSNRDDAHLKRGKRQVFGPVTRTPPKVNLVGYKWVFVRKRDENNVVVR